VRSLRAHSARQAADLIQTYPIHIAVVDLRLPFDSGATADEAGVRVLELLSRLSSPPPTVIVKRGRSMRDDLRDLHHAIRAGAFAAVDPPVELEHMLRVLRRTVERFYGGAWPGAGTG
jgi:DNA-binding NarL/FixJ family response regulator